MPVLNSKMKSEGNSILEKDGKYTFELKIHPDYFEMLIPKDGECFNAKLFNQLRRDIIKTYPNLDITSYELGGDRILIDLGK